MSSTASGELISRPIFSTTLVETTSMAPNASHVFQDSSFSSYLNPKNNVAAQKQENDVNSAVDDSEISIFDAQRYFSEISNELKDPKKLNQQRKREGSSERDLPPPPPAAIQLQSSVSSGRNSGEGFSKSTPTASSEASWNSQKGLLTNPPGSVGVSFKNLPSADDSKKRNTASASKKWFLCPKSCCIGKESVDVEEKTLVMSENSTPVLINVTEKENSSCTNMDKTHGGMLVSAAPNAVTASSPEKNPKPIQAPWRQRILATGKPLLLSPSNSKPGIKDGAMKPIFNDDPSVIRRDHPGMNRPLSVPGSPIARVGVASIDEDVGSDASSDLFEIENLSTPGLCPVYRRRDSLEEAPMFSARRFTSLRGVDEIRRSDEPLTPSRVAATECDAPSEVSINWSVTTAEGYDKASVTDFSVSASEIGTMGIFREKTHQAESGGGEGEEGKRKGNGLLLMGCGQEKAVSVGPQPVPLNVGGRPLRPNKPPAVSSKAERLSLRFAA